MVTLCLPTVRCVPGGSVPAGTLRAAAAAAGAGAETAVSEVTLDRLAMDELCDEKGDAMATVIYGHRQEKERERELAFTSSFVPVCSRSGSRPPFYDRGTRWSCVGDFACVVGWQAGLNNEWGRHKARLLSCATLNRTRRWLRRASTSD
jgi:hypothetical protein